MIQRDKHTLEELQQKITYWEQSLLTKTMEAEVMHTLTYIEDLKMLLDEEDEVSHYNHLESRLLTLLAWERFNRKKKKDKIIEKWLQRAQKLDNNERVKVLQEKLIEIDIRNVLHTISFPRIRETDNRPAKKTTAEDTIKIAEQLRHDLSPFLETSNNGHAFKAMAMQLDNLMKATRAYIDSLTGTFYTSVHLKEVNEAIQQLQQLKITILESLSTEDIEEVKQQTAIEKLDKMIGLSDVKEKVKRLYYFLQFQKQREEEGFQFQDDISLHVILTGNPGTGKTTLARLLAKIYYDLGFLERDDVVEVNRSHLVGGYVGQTEEKTMAIINKAVGGVLFIDEAYSLKREGQSGNDYGQTAIDTLVSAMTSKELGGKFAVMLAGYPEEMRAFLWSNPGLRSRFPESNHIELSDYTMKELLDIASLVAEENDYYLTEGAKEALKTIIEQERVDESFGNARTVKNIVLDAIYKKGANTAKKNGKFSMEDYTILQENDFVAKELEGDRPALIELETLVGLEQIKQDFKKMQAFVSLQNIRKKQQLPTMPVHLHAIFTGNSGTGKTTVAKLYAKLLKEAGYLKRGHLVIASRADLVAGYTGQTALKTRKKVREALGGVLFIDEAYALTPNSQGDFAKEAIDTLVDELTKHGENLVVILAGYTNEMKALVAANNGIASRFRKSYYFPDYSVSELMDIGINYAEKYGYHIRADAKELLHSFLNTVTLAGNARYILNIVEEAIQQQSMRIMDNNEEEINELSKEDFQYVFDKK